jgi:hypothetical protein
VKELPNNMLKPRKAAPLGQADEAWYYVGPTSIDVFVRLQGVDALACRLTRRQLQSALKVMSKSE